MESFLEVYGSGDLKKGDYDLDFYVYTKLYNDVVFTIGNYTVTQDGSVFGSIDKDFCDGGEELLEETKNALLDSGLQEIIGNDLERDKIFDKRPFGDSLDISINFGLCVHPNKERWIRARNYIKSNDIVVYGPTDLQVNRLIKK